MAATVASVNTRRGHADVLDFGAAVVGRQELNRPADRDQVKRSLPRTDHYSPSARWAQRLMTSWDIDQGTVIPTSEWVHLLPAQVRPSTVDPTGVAWLAHGGLRDVTPGRGIIGTLHELAGGLRIVFLNTHFVSSAHSPRRVPFKKWRLKKWLRHKQLLDQVVAGLLEAGFLPVVVGDMNYGKPLQVPGLVNPRAGETHRPKGLDAYDQILAHPDLGIRDFRRADGGNKHGSDHAPREATIGTEEETPVPTITELFEKALRDEGCLVLNRGQWGTTSEATYQARRRSKPHRLLPDRPSDTLWQHITVTEATTDPAADMRALERIGNDRFGSGVSYNVAVHPTGAVLLGQPLDAKGTHTVNVKGIPGYSYDQNYVSLAVAWIGVPGDKPTGEAVDAIADVMRALIKVDALTKGFDYVPHSLVAAKDCPLQSMRDLMPSIRRAGTDTPTLPNKVQRAQVQLEELLATLRRAGKQAESITALLEEVPEERKAVAAFRAAIEGSTDQIKSVRVAVRDAGDQAPKK